MYYSKNGSYWPKGAHLVGSCLFPIVKKVQEREVRHD